MDPIGAYVEEARRLSKGRGVPEEDLPFARTPESGSRPPCVLIHGSTATPRQMSWLADRLVSAGYPTLAPLLPGHGTRRGALERTTPDDCLAELHRAVGACLAWGASPYLLGYSFGAVLSVWQGATGGAAGVVSLAGGCRPRIPLHGWLAMPWPRLAGKLPGVGAPSKAAVWKLRIARFARALRGRARHVRVPLFMWHSVRDRTMRPSGSRIVFREARALSKQLLMTDGPGHPLSLSPDLDEVADAVIRFLGRDHVPREIVLRTSCAGAHRVEVAGSFNSWDRITLTRLGEGVWETKLLVPPGNYEYALLVDGLWQADPASPSGTPWPDGRQTSCLEVL